VPELRPPANGEACPPAVDQFVVITERLDSIAARLEQIESRPPPAGQAGQDGRDGQDGNDGRDAPPIDIDDLANKIEARLKGTLRVVVEPLPP
jgi:hypothetical protein